ncbi:type VI secretion system baseplate subunit TssE [Salmonella enterica subsp. enterica]|nr:type VI secretion system baseplate subunit TssE [Salmonella enterica subsp. enterica]MIF51074.1 type VI secretion system baseplate subunit TssE [Salmonella enterica subsp. enterica]
MRDRGRSAAGSLSERLTDALASRPRSSGMQALQDSIRHNLNNVLNTRPGSCQSAPEMGISDPGSEEQTSGGFRETQIEKIRHCILHYEPRISQAEVTAVDQDENSPLDLRFQITAFVDVEGRRNVLEFNVRLDGFQHYRMD